MAKLSSQTIKGKGQVKGLKKRERTPSQSGSKASGSKDNKETEIENDSVTSANLGGIVVMCILMILMLYAVHCTWVTSNAYSSPSVVLASTNYDG